MNILAVDDEYLALQSLVDALKQNFPEATIRSFELPTEALDYAADFCEDNTQGFDYAFLDVEMPEMTGLEMAAKLKEICPEVRVFFVTAFRDYAYEAYRIHAGGYILKPVTRALIAEEMANIESMFAAHDAEVKEEKSDEKRVQIQTFGNFEVFVDQKPLSFSRSRAKELLAYLVDRRGSGVNLAQICSVLFEEDDGSKKYKKYAHNLIASLTQALESVGAENILIKKWNYLALDAAQVSCDYYRFLKGDIEAVNAFHGEYMSNYSWAEFTAAFLTIH